MRTRTPHAAHQVAWAPQTAGPPKFISREAFDSGEAFVPAQAYEWMTAVEDRMVGACAGAWWVRGAAPRGAHAH